MHLLTSLPVDVLQCILPLLERDTLAELSQTCQLFYALARPMLFKHVTICLNTHYGRLDRPKLQRDVDMLERTHAGQKIGDLVQSLSILSDSGGSRSANRPWDAISMGVASGLAELLRCLPSLRNFRIDGPPSILRPKTPEHKLQYTMLLDQLKGATTIRRLEYVGLPDLTCTWWLRLLLGSLAADLVELDLNVTFGHGTTTLPASFASSQYSLPNLTRLKMTGEDWNDAVAALLDRLLEQSSQLVSLHLYHHYLTLSNFRHIFDRSSTLRTLHFEQCMFSKLGTLKTELFRSRLREFSVVDSHSDAFFWLPYLPSSLVNLRIIMNADDLDIPLRYHARFFFVYEGLESCFANPKWCPHLASLHLRFEGKMGWRPTDIEACHMLEPGLRKGLFTDLTKHRKQPIAVNSEFWVDTDFSESEAESDEDAPASLMD